MSDFTKTLASPEEESWFVNCLCYLSISLNDELHITPKTAAINQSNFAFVPLSYLSSLIPSTWNVCAPFQPNGSGKKKKKRKSYTLPGILSFCLEGSSHCDETGSLLMTEGSLVIRMCLYYRRSQRSNGTLSQATNQVCFNWGIVAQYLACSHACRI